MHRSMIKIKICGLTRLEDAMQAVESGADYLGFIFSESPRKITMGKAYSIIRDLPRRIERVGVFVNAHELFIRQVINQTGLSMIQLHGDETPEFCRRFDLPVIKVFRVKDYRVLNTISKYKTEYILLESYVAGKYGGTGKTVDWSMAAGIVSALPEKKIFLAGGLNPENGSAAARSVRPFALDASSGLEKSPGIKDPEKIIQFIKAVKNTRFAPTGA